MCEDCYYYRQFDGQPDGMCMLYECNTDKDNFCNGFINNNDVIAITNIEE